MRYAMIGSIVAVMIVAGIFFMPAQKAKASTSYHWEAGTAMPDLDGGWVIWARLKDGNGNTVQTVQVGTTDSRRKSRKASRELADSLNEAGSGFNWDPACEGQIFAC